MTRTQLYKCVIRGCRFSRSELYADITQVRKHLWRDHDFKELQQAAFRLGLLKQPLEFREKIWLAGTLAEYCMIKDATKEGMILQ